MNKDKKSRVKGLIKAGRYSNAIRILKKYMRSNPEDAVATRILGNVYFYKTDYEMAIKLYSKVIEIEKDSPHQFAFYNRSLAYKKKGDLARALDDISEAIHLASFFDEALLTRGDLYQRLGDFKLALEDYSEVIDANSEHNSSYSMPEEELSNCRDNRNKALKKRGFLYEERGQYQEALDDFHKVPLDCKVCAHRERVYELMGDWGGELPDIFKDFTQRQYKQNGAVKTNTLTEETRQQLINYYESRIQHDKESFWVHIYNILKIRHGFRTLDLNKDSLPEFLRTCKQEDFLSFVELPFHLKKISLGYENAVVQDVNVILRTAHLPYSLTRMFWATKPPLQVSKYPQIIRIKEKFLSEKVIDPALSVLNQSALSNAAGSFDEALKEDRAGRYNHCLRECGNALESVLKVLYPKFDLTKPQGHVAFKIRLENVFHALKFPASLPKELAGLILQHALLIPAFRNELGSAHGEIGEPRLAGGDIAQFQIALTAATIILLVSAAKKTGSETSMMQ